MNISVPDPEQTFVRKHFPEGTRGVDAVSHAGEVMDMGRRAAISKVLFGARIAAQAALAGEAEQKAHKAELNGDTDRAAALRKKADLDEAKSHQALVEGVLGYSKPERYFVDSDKIDAISTELAKKSTSLLDLELSFDAKGNLTAEDKRRLIELLVEKIGCDAKELKIERNIFGKMGLSRTKFTVIFKGKRVCEFVQMRDHQRRDRNNSATQLSILAPGIRETITHQAISNGFQRRHTLAEFHDADIYGLEPSAREPKPRENTTTIIGVGDSGGESKMITNTAYNREGKALQSKSLVYDTNGQPKYARLNNDGYFRNSEDVPAGINATAA